MLYSILVVVQVVAAIAIIALVLLQQGKGADMGAAFGAGASGTVFGARGSANFLTRTTAILATVFFVTSLSLAYLVNQRGGSGESIVDNQPAVPAVAAPANAEAAPEAAPTIPEAPKIPEVPTEAPK